MKSQISHENMKPPVEICAKLVAEGFTTTQVANAVNGMVSKKQANDQKRSFLRSQDTLEKRHSELGSSDIPDQFPREEENTASTETSTADARAQETLDNEDEYVFFDKATHDEDSSFDGHMAASIPRSRHSRSLHSQPQPLDISSRLDLVAHFENLLDAAFALSEWVMREAKETEVRSREYMWFPVFFTNKKRTDSRACSF
jgi:hypothetical protein